MVIPSILKGVDFSLYEKLGHNIGVLFQLTDDYYDKDGAYVVLGEKPLLKLIQDYKNTIFTLINQTNVSSYLKEYVDFISFGI